MEYVHWIYFTFRMLRMFYPVSSGSLPLTNASTSTYYIPFLLPLLSSF